MFTQSTASFVHGAGGEQAEISVEITPRDQQQFDLFKELQVESTSLEQNAGRFILNIRLKKPGIPIEAEPFVSGEATEGMGEATGEIPGEE